MGNGQDSKEVATRSTESKALELVYTSALTHSTTFKTVGAAVIFGLFSLLLLINPSTLFSLEWALLSLAYFLTVLTGVYFYLRAVRYSMMATEAARRLGILGIAETVYSEAAGPGNFLHKVMVGKFQPYGTFTKIYFIVGPMVLFLLWAVVALH